MPAELLYRVAELERIVRSMIRMGAIAEVDYDNAVCRVSTGGIVTGWLQWATTRAMGERTWWAPRVGEQVMVFSPCGDLAQGKVMAAFYQDAATPPASSPEIHRMEYPDGAWTEYSEATGTLAAYSPKHAQVEAGETIVAKAGKDINAEAGDLISLKAPLINIFGNTAGYGHGGIDEVGTVYEKAHRTIEGSCCVIGPLECSSLTVNGNADIAGNCDASTRSGGTI